MNIFRTMTVNDVNAAASQWASYLKDKLGYDLIGKMSVEIDKGAGQIFIMASDSFQSNLEYQKQVGRCALLENFNLDDDFDDACKRVWVWLQKCMSRDERELRHGMQVMGQVIEGSELYQSAVGKMFADRVKAARDEATAFMIEHHGWKDDAK